MIKTINTQTHTHILVWGFVHNKFLKKSVAKIPAHLPPEDRHAFEKQDSITQTALPKTGWVR